MTQEEFDAIVAAVIASLKTNGKTIAQLTPVTSLANSDSLEVSGGKKISFGKLKEIVAADVTVSAEEIKGYVVAVIADNLTTDDAEKVLSAKQGKVLKGLIDNIKITVVNDLTTGGERNALSAEMGKRLGEDVYTDEMLTPALVSEQNAFLISNKGAKYANNSLTLNTYAVEPGSAYYIRYTDSVANGNVYQYNWYATEEDAIAGTNGLATIYQRLQAELNLKVTAPEGAHYLNVSFLKTSNYGVYIDGRYKTKYADHERRLDEIEEKLSDLPEEQPIVNLERVNLFDQTKVLEGYIMDGTNGRMCPFTQNGYCYAVAKVPAIKGKYYCIYNPYYNYQRATTKVGTLNNNGTSDWGNYNQDNIVLLDSHWIIAQAIWTNNTDVAVDHISFQLYWGPTKPNYQDTPLVEVYEMESAEEAVSWVRAKCGQTMKLSPQVSIDDALLSANVATLGSAYMDKSVVIFGDSISADHAWSEYMMNKLKLRNIFNFGIGGASIQYNRENLDLLSQINDVATRMSATCYLQGTLQDSVYVYPVDCVMICLGHNDVGGGSGHAIGDFATVRDTSWENLAPTGTLFTGGILAAFKYCLFLMKTTIITSEVTINGNTVTVGVDFRNAKFMYQSPIQTTADDTAAGIPYTYAQLRSALKEICEYYSVIYIDSWTRAGINKEEELLYQAQSGSTYGKFLKDGTHPTEQGYIKLGEMMASALISNFM